MPNTRSGNRTANFKAYYSKKAAPHQQHFPHRRKTVRRPGPHDDDTKKQMKFLPEMMRRKGTVQDSDDEGEQSIEDSFEDVEKERSAIKGRQVRKRNCDAISGEVEELEEPVRPTPKRRRKSPVTRIASKPTSSRKRAAASIAPALEDVGSDSNDIIGREEQLVPKRNLRKQSTMTQIVDGRSPVPGSIDPEFKRVKRTTRTSWGGKSNKNAAKDAKQRTLTQMVHNLTPLVLDSDEDPEGSETEEEMDTAHHSFIFGNDEETAAAQYKPAENVKEEIPHTSESSVLAADNGDSDEDEYHPTQFIEGPVRRTRRTPLRSSTQCKATPAPKLAAKTSPKSRFGLLSTPEKRGVLEIPSSQSPIETLLSTQNTPQRSGRRPLKPRSANALSMADTPSKRGVETPSKRKQVTFKEGLQERIPPPALRKFASTIPDSDDELGDLSDSDCQSDTESGSREQKQAMLRDPGRVGSGTNVGAETQAMLLDIDRAYAHADEDGQRAARSNSEELGGPIHYHDTEAPQDPILHSENHTAPIRSVEISSGAPDLPALPFSSPQPRDSMLAIEQHSVVTDTLTAPPTVQQLPSSPPIEEFRTQPPNPMFPEDPSSEEIEGPTSVTVKQPSTPIKQPLSSPPIEDFRTQPTVPMFNDDDPSEDLDDTPNATPPAPRQNDIQVICSPPRLHAEPSHSSQAEQQLHSEYQTYTQYHRPGLFSSSMHVAHDSNYSYQATPRPGPSHQPTQSLPQTHTTHISQATTVDPTQISPRVTPHKPRIKKEPMFTRSATRTPKSQGRYRSATTTPKSQRLQGMSSPEASKPPPLFIPSSFPSPARVTMEGWSSPLLGRTGGESQWGQGSLEDFSIPAPPPGEWVDDDEDDEEL